MAKADSERSFRYQRRSKEDLKERANSRGGGFDTFIKPKYKLYKVRDGKNVIRVLPPTWKDAKHYGYDIWVNYGIGVDNQSYLSLSKMKSEKDPLAEARREAESEGDEKTAKGLQARQRILMWVVDRQDEDEGPQLWSAPFTVDKSLANVSFDEDTKEVMYIDDPEKGCDIRFYKEGTGLKTKYDASKMKLMKPGFLHEDEAIQDEWLQYVQDNPVPECLQFYTYEQIASAFNGHVRTEDDDDDEKPRGKGRGRTRDDDEEAAPKRTRKAAVEDDEEPAPRKRTRAEPEDEEEPPKRARGKLAEEDEEPAPRKRTRAEPEEDATPLSRKRKVEPEEDEPPPFDEDPPAKRARGKLADADDDEPAPRKRTRAEPEDEEPEEGSIRDRLRRRRSAGKDTAEDDE